MKNLRNELYQFILTSHDQNSYKILNYIEDTQLQTDKNNLPRTFGTSVDSPEQSFCNLELIPESDSEDDFSNDDIKKISQEINFNEPPLLNNIKGEKSHQTQAQSQFGLKKCELKKISKRRRLKIIRYLKKRLDREIMGGKKTFKVKKYFVKMSKKDFYDKYILKNLTVKEIFSEFGKFNRMIFRKIKRKIKSNEFELFISTKIGDFFENFTISSSA